jgi:hypothetical protein
MYQVKKLTFNVPEKEKVPNTYFHLLSLVCNSKLWDDRRLFEYSLDGAINAISDEFRRLLKVHIRNEKLDRSLLDYYDPEHILCLVNNNPSTSTIVAGGFVFIEQLALDGPIKLVLTCNNDEPF